MSISPSGSPSASPVDHTAPPYWDLEEDPTSSNLPVGTSAPAWSSSAKGKPRKKQIRSGPISLVDNTEDDQSVQNKASWAKSARIDEFVTVGHGLGAYVVFCCVVETSNVCIKPSSLGIYHRFVMILSS